MKQNTNLESQILFLKEKIVPVIEQQIKMLPENKLDYKPADNTMSLKELAFHVVNSPWLYLKGVELGTIDKIEFSKINLNLVDVTQIDQLLDYYSKFMSYLKAFSKKMKTLDLSPSITYSLADVGWGSWSLPIDQAVKTAVEEAIHHRGQLSLYLRLLQVTPPKIYPYL